MNKKIIAIIIPLMMVLSGVVVAANTVADDSTSTSSDTNKQSFIVGESFYLNVNEANYINYDYVAEWVINGNVLAKSTNSTEYSAFSVKSVVSNGVKYSIIPEKTLGNYKIKTEEVVNETLGETPIEWKITVTINSKTSIEKTINATKTLVPTPAEKLTFKWAKGTDHKDPAVNTVYDEAIVANLGKNNFGSYTDVSFYAIGLPAGLSMSSDGHINGIAKNAGNTIANIAVSYTDCDVKKIATGTFEINVVAMGEITFTMNLANSNEAAPGVKIDDGSFFIAEESDKDHPMKLTIKPTNEKWQANAHVKVVSSSGVVSDESKFNQTFDIPVNGTGAYTVIVTYAGVIQSFTLYVLPAGALSADIIISGN